VAGGRTLFFDNFASDPMGTGVPAGWLLADPTAVDGGLPLVGGLLGGLPIVGSHSVATLLPSVVTDGTQVLSRVTGAWSHIAAGPVLTDFSASADVKPMSGDLGFAGVAGRFQDASNFLSCGVRNGSSLQLWQVIGGQQRLLAAAPVSLASGVFQTVSMNMVGRQLSCALNGVTLLRGATSSITSGRIGLIALGDLATAFDNVRAIALT
jgi:hypothetical protein